MWSVLSVTRGISQGLVMQCKLSWSVWGCVRLVLICEKLCDRWSCWREWILLERMVMGPICRFEWFGLACRSGGSLRFNFRLHANVGGFDICLHDPVLDGDEETIPSANELLASPLDESSTPSVVSTASTQPDVIVSLFVSAFSDADTNDLFHNYWQSAIPFQWGQSPCSCVKLRILSRDKCTLDLLVLGLHAEKPLVTCLHKIVWLVEPFNPAWPWLCPQLWLNLWAQAQAVKHQCSISGNITTRSVALLERSLNSGAVLYRHSESFSRSMTSWWQTMRGSQGAKSQMSYFGDGQAAEVEQNLLCSHFWHTQSGDVSSAQLTRQADLLIAPQRHDVEYEGHYEYLQDSLKGCERIHKYKPAIPVIRTLLNSSDQFPNYQVPVLVVNLPNSRHCSSHACYLAIWPMRMFRVWHIPVLQACIRGEIAAQKVFLQGCDVKGR